MSVKLCITYSLVRPTICHQLSCTNNVASFKEAIIKHFEPAEIPPEAILVAVHPGSTRSLEALKEKHIAWDVEGGTTVNVQFMSTRPTLEMLLKCGSLVPPKKVAS